MKYRIICVFALMTHTVGFTQQVPTINNPPNGGVNSGTYWSMAGNNNGPNGNNIFGTRWNSPIYFITGAGFTQNSYKMRLNGNFVNGTQYPINGFTGFTGVNTSGYLGLGTNLDGIWSQNTGLARGPFSLLHLNGPNGTFVQTFGYRPWMKAGVTFTDNQDLSYIGLRRVGNGFDVTETTFAWSDNASGASGPDDVIFRFTGGSAADGAGAVSNNFNTTADSDGRHVLRLTGDGHMALGNTFGINVAGASPGYVRPQSHFHMTHNSFSSSDDQWGFMQITYRDLTGETANDGLRWGIDRVQGNTNGYLRWQENSAFIVQTDWNNAAGGIANGERMRITTVNDNLVANPGGLPNNTTRVAISHIGNDPVTSPRSLLHLGYNTGTQVGPGGATDGWRTWMDVGTFTSSGSDNMYVGLKREGTDKEDAVINWGDNQLSGNLPGQNNGPDNLRFIFTSTTTALTGQGDPISQSQDGLETGRFYPGYDETFTYTPSLPVGVSSQEYYGRFGVGDFTASGVNEEPSHKIDVVGNGRFRFLPDSLYIADSLVNKYVMVDSMGVLRWTNSSPGGFAVACADSVGGKLQFDSKVDLNNYNLYFENNDLLGENHIGVGYDCGNVLPGKLSVQQVHPATVGVSTKSISGINSDVANVVALTYSGVYGEANGLQNPPLRATNIGGDFRALYGVQNFGVFGAIQVPASYPSGLFAYNVGGSFRAIGPGFSNVGGLFQGYGGSNVNYGIHTSVSTTPGSFSTAILAYAPAEPNHFAAHFTGDVYMNGVTVSTSDENLKENVAPLDNALDVINSLNPVSFEFKQTGIYDRMNMPEGNRFGLIAQEVQPILPELVRPGVYPAAYDSLGNETDAAIDFLTMDYESLIPIIIKGMQEQQAQINEKDSIINDLNNRLTNLENCLSGLLPVLCQISNSSIEINSEETAREIQQAIDVHLSDKSAIILNQNVPNPFAERSVITYSIPANVEKAQIIFYDAQGKLINAVDINERGEGQLNVFASDLSTGVYTYSLVADGKVVATKRMMKQ